MAILPLAPQTLRLGQRLIGDGQPCLLVAELGSAHLGDLSRARELIDAAVEAGADCVKFQVIIADEILHPRTGAVSLPGGEISLYERFRDLERPEAFYAALKEHTERRGVLFLASAFGPESARLLRRLGVAAFKVASPEVNHFPLLRQLSGYGLPVLLSTGVSTLGDIERALGVLRDAPPPGAGPGAIDGGMPTAGGAAPVVVLHCVTAYPAPEVQYNLRVLPLLRGIFGTQVGVSDHSAELLLVPAIAVLQGACVVEKHLTLARRGGGLDDPIALEPQEFARMSAGVRRLEGLLGAVRAGTPPVAAAVAEAAVTTSAATPAAAGGPVAEALAELERQYGAERIAAVLGDGIKRLAPAEARYYRTTNRSLHARMEIRAGSVIRGEDVCIVRSESNLRPGLGPEFLEVVTGCVARRAIPAGEGIVWEDLVGRGGASPAEPATAGNAQPGGADPGLDPVDCAEELLQLVDREERPVGAATRGVCHGNPSLIQAVVHLYLFDPTGRLYLQRRAAGKAVFPGRWDTSVGGHLAPGETPEQALLREAAEELGLSGEVVAGAEPLERYLFECDFESEYVFVYRLITEAEPRPDPAEIAEGRFFEARELERLVRDDPQAFTPHFREAFERLCRSADP